MNRFLLTMAMACFALSCYAQQKWEKLTSYKQETAKIGADEKTKPYKDKDYNYGSVANPSPRTDAVTWLDSKGGIWLFGGVGWDENYQWGIFQDMWKYDTKTNNWALAIKEGRNVSLALGESKAVQESPKPRKNAVSWTDAKGDLWMYGGQTLIDFQYLDDLWKFETNKNEWRKVKGDGKINVKANHGEKKRLSDSNQPGSRVSPTYWADEKGNLWLFGGASHVETQTDLTTLFSDLWQFDVNKSQWVWMDGVEKANQVSKSKAESPTPSPRMGASVWHDSKGNKVYMYGGFGFDTTGAMTGGLSDFWSYSLKSNQWELLDKGKGLNASSEIFTYGSRENSPGFRVRASGWADFDTGNLYLLGGHKSAGYDVVSSDNRVWCFDLKSGNWHTINQSGAPGTLGALAAFKISKGEVILLVEEEFYEAQYHFRPSSVLWKLGY